MTKPLPRRASSTQPSWRRFWPLMVGACLLLAGVSSLWSARSASAQVVQLSAERDSVTTQRDFVANRAADFAADALSACSDDEIAGKLPPAMCSTASRIVSEPMPKQIVGPPGERGLQGVQGVSGPVGVQGPEGLPGKNGAGIESLAFQASAGSCFAVTKLSDGRVLRSEVARQICVSSTSSPSEVPSAEPTPG